MKAIDLIILNFKEVRRRSIKMWNEIPSDKLNWKPDDEAMTCIEMVRHVLESPLIYQCIINGRGTLDGFVSPWEGRPYGSVDEEIEFSVPYTVAFFEMLNSFTEEQLESIEIIRTDRNQQRKLGDYLLRIAYHESVHTGQMLSYFRTMGIERPEIWD